jgi:hypothetical protein
MKFIQLEKLNFKSKRHQGRVVERWFKQYLSEVLGYESILSYNSESPFDLIGFKQDEVLLIQLRSGGALKWSKSVEIKRMLDFPCPAFCRKLIARIDPYDSEVHFRDLADRTKSWRVKKSLEQRNKIKALRERRAKSRAKRAENKTLGRDE